LHTHVKREWWVFETVVKVLTLKYLYEPKEAVFSMGPQLVNEGSAS